ncbi:MAG: helix-turn-helix transcriptional regulator [Deltaproteobacteria bacterium]|nr:helix-turn-helix transcriptional regulator [Deltaproteobacteria bacterium]
MSVAAKMRLTKIEISEGKKRKLYLVPKEAAEAVATLLGGFDERQNEDEGPIDAFDLYPHLKDPVKRAATVFQGIRLRHGLTQKEMGDKLGLHQTDVSKIEKGERSIGKKLAIRIGKALGIDYKRFL